MATLEAIVYKRGSLRILDQLLIPQQFKYEDIINVQQGFDAIRTMKVRGAPAIAIVAMLAIAVDCFHSQQQFTTNEARRVELLKQLDYIGQSRPTAVNLFIAIEDMKNRIQTLMSSSASTTDNLFEKFMDWSEEMISDNIKENENIGTFGSDYIVKNCMNTTGKLSILTHCNTGGLATIKYGTALGVIRFLHHKKQAIEQVYCTETRPYNQGSRLTAFELVYEKIPATLIVDSAVSFLMAQRKIDAVIVGADRICNNGDTANKVGTYQIAIAAKYHNIPFFVAAPFSSIDLKLENGKLIHIEERSATEITHNPNNKEQRVVVEGINVWNPSFDIVPSELITGGIITEKGVIVPNHSVGQPHFDIKNWKQ